MISHLGAMLPVADGLALAAQLRGEPRVAAAFTGDGATSEGDFHEALNLAAVWKLPVLFVIENNQYGLSTPVVRAVRLRAISPTAASATACPAWSCDGNDLLAVMRAVREAAARARRGEGPTLLEFKTFRMRGHEEASGTAYVPKELFEEWAAQDPLLRFERAARRARPAAGRASATRCVRRSRTRSTRSSTRRSREPDPASTAEARAARTSTRRRCRVATARRDVAAVGDAREMRYVDAITRRPARGDARAIREVVLIGQDIAEYGGVFKVTEGFVEEFGKARVRNTPIIESGAIGAALGLALDGFLPMVEMQFGDFISCGFNQIVNNLAKTHYRWGAGVPVVVRVPIGGGTGAGRSTRRTSKRGSRTSPA